MLNQGNREKTNDLEIIFTKGAMRAATKALHRGLGLGTLIDQNTRGRDGGEFVNFFGLPVACSKAPATMMRYCRQNNLKSVIIYGTSIREADGKVCAYMELLPKPFEDYASDEAVIQDVMNISERYIRRYPEQYLWLYKRFLYIPREISPELKSRYPYYAKVISDTFYTKKKFTVPK
ncbi:MAG: lysophospholipid acyltransferase family protein [Victivallaceae bacterium]